MDGKQEEIRRKGDDRLDFLVDGMNQLRSEVRHLTNGLAIVKNLHSEFYGRLDQRVISAEKETKNHSDELRELDRRVDEHEKWINVSTGRVTGISAAMGTLGAIVIWVIDHLARK